MLISACSSIMIQCSLIGFFNWCQYQIFRSLDTIKLCLSDTVQTTDAERPITPTCRSLSAASAAPPCPTSSYMEKKKPTLYPWYHYGGSTGYWTWYRHRLYHLKTGTSQNQYLYIRSMDQKHKIAYFNPKLLSFLFCGSQCIHTDMHFFHLMFALTNLAIDMSRGIIDQKCTP